MNPRPKIGLSMNYMKLGSYHQFHIRDKYIDAIYQHGGLPCPIPCFEDKEVLRQYLSGIQALIIIGGLDYPPALYGEPLDPHSEIMEPRRAKSDYLLLELCLELDLPVLGICAGMQLMNIFFGGKLIQHLPELDAHFGEKYHEIRITGGRWLPAIFSADSLLVNSNHHQGIDARHLGKGLKPVAYAADGRIEALEYDRKTMFLGIQWHPERITDPEHRKSIFEFFFNYASNQATQTPH